MKYYGIWAMRGASSIFGAAEAWCKGPDGDYEVYASQEKAAQVADEYNQSKSPLASVHYGVREMEPKMAEDILRKREQTQSEQGLSL